MEKMKPKLLTESHLHGEIIIKHGFTNEYSELKRALETTNIPLRAATPFTSGKRPDTPKRQLKKIQGRKAYALMPIDRLNSNLDRCPQCFMKIEESCGEPYCRGCGRLI